MDRDELMALLVHRDRQIEAVRRTGDALFSHPSVEALVRATLQIALDVLRADAGTVFLHDGKDDSLVFRYVIGAAADQLTGKRIPASQGGVAWTVFRTGKPDLIGDVAKRGDFNRKIDESTGYHTESMMTVPVKRTDGDPIGVMQVLNARVPFTGQDLEVLQVLCSSAATGIEHARLAHEARKAEIVHVIGDISHDIKNMLTPILTGVWTLEPMLKRLFDELDAIRACCPETETWGNDIARTADVIRYDYGWMLENVLLSAEQVQSRTKEIADAVKGEMAPPFFEETSLNERCEAVARPLKVVADKAGVTLDLDLDRDLPPVEIDRHQIYNALYNLVNNAIPETPAGGSVTLRTRGPQSADDECVTVEVQDTGRGIPEAVRQRLFTDEAISTKPGGTGLGTRIVAGVVRRHNGKITVQSEEGVGSTFTVSLPIRHRDTA
jgi:signal transduction histidine kinase